MPLHSEVIIFTRFSENLALRLRPPTFSRCTYGVNFQVLSDFLVELSHSQTSVSTLTARQSDDNTPSAFLAEGLKGYAVPFKGVDLISQLTLINVGAFLTLVR